MSSDDESYIPIGLSMLRLKTTGTPIPVMVQKPKEESPDLPTALQYYNLLSRAMALLNKEDEGERLKLTLSVFRKNRKTYINVADLARQLKRQPEHLASFLLKSFLSEGSINKDGQLVVAGSHLQSVVEKALRQFMELYVVCKTCRGVEDTYICRENKLYFLRCEKCKASRCVGNAIEGFSIRE